MDLKEEKKDEMNQLNEKLRDNNLQENDLIDMKDKMKYTIKGIQIKREKLGKRILMNKSIRFEEKDSKEFGQLVIKNDLNLEINQDSGKLIKTFQGHTNSVFCIEQIEDFTKIITCSADFSIKIWSKESGECLKTLKGHQEPISSLIISNDKKYLISGSWDGTIKVWNIENDIEFVQTLLQEESVWSLCLLPSNILVCGLSNGKLTKWNLNNFSKINSFKAHEKSIVWQLKHVSSSQIVSCSRDRKIKLWNLETNECLRTLVGHTDQVNCLEVSSDKSKLYSGSGDKSLRVWDISSGECLKTINLGSWIVCLRLMSSNYLAVGLYDIKENLKIIDLNSDKIVKSIETQSLEVCSLNFNPDANLLFSGLLNGHIKMWEF
jgi:WD40 repeat protein